MSSLFTKGYLSLLEYFVMLVCALFLGDFAEVVFYIICGECDQFSSIQFYYKKKDQTASYVTVKYITR